MTVNITIDISNNLDRTQSIPLVLQKLFKLLKMSLNIQQVSDSARKIATKLGISKFDLSGSTTDSVSVEVDRGEQKQVKASNRSGITVRVWNQDNTVGITSTTDVDDMG